MYAVIRFPNFTLQAALRGFPELWSLPVALVDPARTPPRLCAVTAAAHAQGVEVDHTPTQAQARCATLLIRPRSVERETTADEVVSQCVYGFSPHFEHTSPGLFTLELRGLAELKEAPPATLRRWANRLRSALAAVELRAQIGLGPTPNLARHAAHSTSTDACEVVTDPEAFVAALPVAALEPSPAVAAIIAQWGVRTVGELRALGMAAVTDRLGLEALSLFAAAATHTTRPLRLVKPAERFAETYDFEEPVETLEPVLFLLRRMVDQLALRLEPAGLVAGELRWQLKLESGVKLDRVITVPDPTRHADVLFRMLHTQLESVRTDAAVTGVSLTVHPGRPLTRQFSLFQTVLRDPGQLQETLGRLSALLGADRVGSPVHLAGRGHERDGFRLEPPDFEQLTTTEPARPALLQPIPWRRLRPAPGTQVETARPTATSSPSESPRPVAVRGNVATGRLKITIGPWHASGRWWEPGAWSREEWEVETTDGTALRLSHTATGWNVTDVLD